MAGACVAHDVHGQGAWQHAAMGALYIAHGKSHVESGFGDNDPSHIFHDLSMHFCVRLVEKV